MEIGTFARLRALVLGRPLLVDASDQPSPLFVNIEVNRLNRLVFIVVRGHVTPNAAREVLAQLAAADVPEFAKIVDISGTSADLDDGEAKRLAVLIRRAADASCGRVALVVDRERAMVGQRLTELLQDDSQVAVVHSLQAARVFVHRGLSSLFDDQSQAAD